MKNETKNINETINYDTDIGDVFRLTLKKDAMCDTSYDNYVDVQVCDIWEEENNPNITAIVRVLDTDQTNAGYGFCDNPIDYVNLKDIKSVEHITYLG